MNDGQGVRMEDKAMNTIMTDEQASLRQAARTAGWLYLAMAFFSAFSMMFVTPKVLVRGDAAATAANILASERLFRLVRDDELAWKPGDGDPPQPRQADGRLHGEGHGRARHFAAQR